MIHVAKGYTLGYVGIRVACDAPFIPVQVIDKRPPYPTREQSDALSPPTWPELDSLPSMQDTGIRLRQTRTMNNLWESPPSPITPLYRLPVPVLFSSETYASADHLKDKHAENSTALSKARKVTQTF